jgi:hypothetical protein
MQVEVVVHEAQGAGPAHLAGAYRRTECVASARCPASKGKPGRRRGWGPTAAAGLLRRHPGTGPRIAGRRPRPATASR